jgi:hypothetical protein
MSTTRIYAPDGEIGDEPVALAASPPVLTGRRLAILDNGKPGALHLLERAAAQIARRTGAVLVPARRKRTAATPCDPALLVEIAASADVVLTGSAD